MMKSPLWWVLCVIAVGIGLFALLAYEVKEGRTVAFDKNVLLAMRRPGDLLPVGPAAAQIAARDITALGGATFLWMVTAFVAGYLAFIGRWRMALFICLSAGSGFIVSALLRDFFGRQRPELVPYMTIVTSHYGFPSGHSFMSAFYYLLLAAIVTWSRGSRMRAYFFVIALLLVFLVGSSRVYLGVHWPTDVLGGWIGGAIWAMLLCLIARWLQSRGVLKQGG